MTRKAPNVLTMYDIKKLCYEAKPETFGVSGIISELRPKFSKELDGREFTFYFNEGDILNYRFKEHGWIEWSKNGSPMVEERADCLPCSVEGVFLIHHMKTNCIPFEASTIVMDTIQNQVTLINQHIGTALSNRDISRTVQFGTIGKTAEPKNEMTEELLGVVMDWKYAENVIIHQIYETISCCAFVSPPPEKVLEWHDFFVTFNPTNYIKIREKLYLLSFYAPGNSGSGIAVSMLMDINKMVQVGATFGIDRNDTLKSYTFGAIGSYAPVGFIGQYTIK